MCSISGTACLHRASILTHHDFVLAPLACSTATQPPCLLLLRACSAASMTDVIKSALDAPTPSSPSIGSQQGEAMPLLEQAAGREDLPPGKLPPSAPTHPALPGGIKRGAAGTVPGSDPGGAPGTAALQGAAGVPGPGAAAAARGQGAHGATGGAQAGVPSRSESMGKAVVQRQEGSFQRMPSGVPAQLNVFPLPLWPMAHPAPA